MNEENTRLRNSRKRVLTEKHVTMNNCHKNNNYNINKSFEIR